ncbi:TetR/AcrR family transcriptional regulator [Candidatus Mycobacterium wuenschmannii]|uniref:TetR/AcrR family transcriptional regulator n=1 Tax=Candidatus Mycobacterium wuenschmannii TaxID=3027808 RepID=A0ABY8VVZ8_9MYCO|nr:TetR/AcrR family transcriptional regulator [Candidatus Mycobacterium wuenschmannii]WIM86333.1 TetR/AcrR family transcriptional regulator [Candidatus Mycobacterium wuenschmannii]
MDAIAPPDRFKARKQPKQDRATQTRNRILDAAAHVFAEYGYRAGTTNRIAEGAEVSIGSLYQYFPNKDAILHALMDAHVDAGADLLGKRLADGLPERLDDALRVFVRATIDNHRDNPRLHRVLFEEAPRAPAFLARLHDLENAMVDAATELLDSHPEARATGRLSARVVVATIESLVHRLITAPEPVDARQLEDELVSMLTGYVGRQATSTT